VISVITALALYLIFQVFIYVKNQYYLPRIWKIFNIVIVVLIIIASVVASLFSDTYKTYTGVSVATWVICFSTIVYSGEKIV
jgi:hypothetical protein